MTTPEDSAALREERDRLRAVIAEAITRCPNCEGRGWRRFGGANGLSDVRCWVCRPWREALTGEGAE